jgi:hypothetical protein
VYCDLLDTVKTVDNINIAIAEGTMMESLLKGKHLVLSMSQAIDSNVILTLIKDNMNNNNPFLQAVEKGYIRIANPGFDSIRDYFLKTLSRGEENPNNQFIFSSMPFIEEHYNKDWQQKIYEAMIKQFVNGASFCEIQIEKGHKQIIENNVSAIMRLDAVTKKDENTYKQSYIRYKPSLVSFKPLLHKRASSYLEEVRKDKNDREKIEKKTLTDLLSTICTESASKDTLSNYRSYYYRLLRERDNDYDPRMIGEIIQLIDQCYNLHYAEQIPDPEEALISVPDIYPNLADFTSRHKNLTSNNIKIIADAGSPADFLSWPLLIEVISEVDEIIQNKGYTREEAIRECIKNPWIRFTKDGLAYLAITVGLTAASFFIPPIAMKVTEFGTGIFLNIISDEVNNHLHKPSSLSEIKRDIKASNKKRRLLEYALGNESETVKK